MLIDKSIAIFISQQLQSMAGLMIRPDRTPLEKGRYKPSLKICKRYLLYLKADSDTATGPHMWNTLDEVCWYTTVCWHLRLAQLHRWNPHAPRYCRGCLRQLYIFRFFRRHGIQIRRDSKHSRLLKTLRLHGLNSGRSIPWRVSFRFCAMRWWWS